jgi:hypothetical protein
VLDCEILRFSNSGFGRNLLVVSPQLRPVLEAFTAVDKAFFIYDRDMIGSGCFLDLDTTKKVFCGLFSFKLIG